MPRFPAPLFTLSWGDSRLTRHLPMRTGCCRRAWHGHLARDRVTHFPARSPVWGECDMGRMPMPRSSGGSLRLPFGAKQACHGHPGWGPEVLPRVTPVTAAAKTDGTRVTNGPDMGTGGRFFQWRRNVDGANAKKAFGIRILGRYEKLWRENATGQST